MIQTEPFSEMANLDAWFLESQEEEIGIYQSSLEEISPQEGGKESKQGELWKFMLPL